MPMVRLTADTKATSRRRPMTGCCRHSDTRTSRSPRPSRNVVKNLCVPASGASQAFCCKELQGLLQMEGGEVVSPFGECTLHCGSWEALVLWVLAPSHLQTVTTCTAPTMLLKQFLHVESVLQETGQTNSPGPLGSGCTLPSRPLQGRPPPA